MTDTEWELCQNQVELVRKEKNAEIKRLRVQILHAYHEGHGNGWSSALAGETVNTPETRGRAWGTSQARRLLGLS